MAKHILIFWFFIGVCVFAGNAQPLSRYDFRMKNFQRVWFTSVGAGANVYYGDHDTHNFAGDRMAPAVEIAVGKYMNPYWALRGQYSGIAMEGLNIDQTPYTGVEPEYGGMYIEKFSYMNIHVDAMVNMLTLFNGFADNRTFDLMPYAGLGYVRSWKGDANAAGMSFDMGVLSKFALAPMLDFNAELKGTLMNDKIDGVTGRVTMDGALSVSFGLTYKFTSGSFHRPRYSPKVRRR